MGGRARRCPAWVVPVELILGRSDSAVVMLTGMRAFPTGLGMSLYAELHAQPFLEAAARAQPVWPT